MSVSYQNFRVLSKIWPLSISLYLLLPGTRVATHTSWIAKIILQSHLMHMIMTSVFIISPISWEIFYHHSKSNATIRSDNNRKRTYPYTIEILKNGVTIFTILYNFQNFGDTFSLSNFSWLYSRCYLPISPCYTWTCENAFDSHPQKMVCNQNFYNVNYNFCFSQLQEFYLD